MKIGMIFSVIFWTMMGVAAPSDINIKNKKIAADILDAYSRAKFISAQIDKIDEKLTLGTRATGQGTIKYGTGRFFLSLSSDKKTELYFKDNKLTVVDYPDQDFDKNGVRKVIVSKSAPVFLQSLMDLFSNSKKFFREFSVVDTTHKDGVLTLQLKPKSKNLKSFKLVMNSKSRTIESVSFTDDVETQTTIIFKSVDLKKKISKSTFEYKIQKTDQVVTQ